MQKSAEPYFNGVNKIRELQNDILHRWTLQFCLLAHRKLRVMTTSTVTCFRPQYKCILYWIRFLSAVTILLL
jgi:hypothetical protein